MTTSLANDARILKKVFARLDAAEDPTGQDAAFRVADRALKAAGLTWTQLLETHLDKTKPVPTSQGESFASMFEGIFGDFAARAARQAASPPPPPRPAYRPIIQGEEIPNSIVGRIKVTDDRKTRDGQRMVVVTVEGHAATYGPVAMFNSAEIERWEQNKDAYFRVQVRQPMSKRLMPIIFGLRAV